MAGAWVNNNSYSPGKRHFVPGGVTRIPGRVEERHGYRYEYFADVAMSPTLCNQNGRSLKETGYICTRIETGKRSHSHGGLSAKDKVNLLQRNLCSYCLKKYIEHRPELKAAVMAVQQASVMSE